MPKGRYGPLLQPGQAPGPPSVQAGIFRLALLLAFLMPAALFGAAVVAEGSEQQGGGFRPPYLGQLDSYREETVALFRQREEKRARLRRLEESVRMHTIKPGETLSGIALLYGVEVGALAAWNELFNPDHIKAGEVLHVLMLEGALHRIKEGDTLATVASRYNVDKSLIESFNVLEGGDFLPEGEKLVIPGATPLPYEAVKMKGSALLALASRGSGGGDAVLSFRWPLQGTVTSYFGRRNGQFHFGLDIAAPYGSEVGAVAAGIVQYTGIQRGYGLMLTIDHGNGWSSLYAHNSRLLVRVGDWVSAGQPIARVGASGNATGPHLHLEIMQDEKKLNPLLFLPWHQAGAI